MNLTFQERPHLVKGYLSTPKDLSKGVVHGIDAGTREEDFLANIRVHAHAVCIVGTRMLGQSQTALLHFEGLQLPQLVYFYGGEMPCRCRHSSSAPSAKHPDTYQTSAPAQRLEHASFTTFPTQKPATPAFRSAPCAEGRISQLQQNAQTN
ncbi:hypothetical protein HPB52_021219 [Rhipicephalus sanguineus]|uniref:Uncharacterized protein n=1 Tax=Rhipicephalus sanguineus TaxID=34632 RepID=A0A9D4Q343_RHISA|nr:hypothetical protein HPB52_021219 [Rhipicephalus sanguineus]